LAVNQSPKLNRFISNLFLEIITGARLITDRDGRAARPRHIIIAVYRGGGNRIRYFDVATTVGQQHTTVNNNTIKLKSLHKNCFARERTEKATVISK